MISLGITFLTGRYHATPWGRHVNEAAPEWPPSPWRLLRAFVATWKRKLDGNPDCEPKIVESLLKKLSANPHYYLPPASLGHTRHYMPWYKKGPTDKTLVFDAWVTLNKNASVILAWPDVTLSATERRALETISTHISFLGRAESWVELRVLSDEESTAIMTKINCIPSEDSTERPDFDPIRVLCLDPATAFLNEYTPKNVKTIEKGTNKRSIEIPLYNPDWHLCMETLELHDKKWSDPPGSRWVTYQRPANCFAVMEHAAKDSVKRTPPTVARFAVDGQVLPLVEDTLWIAEKARITAMGCYRRVEEHRLFQGNVPIGAPKPRSEAFSGKDDTGSPLEGHVHAYYLPTDEDGDGRIDHLTIVADKGFGPSDVKALDRMRRLKRDDGEPLNLVMLALGDENKVAPCQLFGPSCVWISATPFFTTRYPKRRGTKKDPPELLGIDNQRKFARHVLIEEIDRLRKRRTDVPEPLSVESLNDEHRCSKRQLRPIQFKQFRRFKMENRGSRAAGAFRIVFLTPVRGPIALGYGAHFGLGLFVPDKGGADTQDSK